MKNSIKLLMPLVLVFALTALSCPNDSASDERSGEEPRAKSGTKRGVGYNFTTAYSGGNSSPQKKTTQWTDHEMKLLKSGANPVQWFYAWGVKPNETATQYANENGILYIPMVWNNTYTEKDIRDIVNAAKPRPEYILAFNEPNFPDQSNMSPADAAKAWPRLKAIAKELNLKIVSPAMNFAGSNSQWPNPIAWLDEFFKQPGVSVNDVAAIAVHSYPWWPSAMKHHMEGYKKYGKPIWLTEFCGWEDLQQRTASEELQAWYMTQALVYLELDPYIERYAWYIPKGHVAQNASPFHNLLTDVELNGSTPPQLTPLGYIYVNMTVCDKTRWDKTGKGEKVDASQFTDCNMSEHIGKRDSWADIVQTRVTQDTDQSAGALEINDFNNNKWVEYQIDVPESKAYELKLRYKAVPRNSGVTEASLLLSIDGGAEKTITLPVANGWQEASVSVTVPSGQHKLRFKASGNSATWSLNWFSLN